MRVPATMGGSSAAPEAPTEPSVTLVHRIIPNDPLVDASRPPGASRTVTIACPKSSKCKNDDTFSAWTSA